MIASLFTCKIPVSKKQDLKIECCGVQKTCKLKKSGSEYVNMHKYCVISPFLIHNIKTWSIKLHCTSCKD